ncbi:hypothetical protein D6C76_08405 [Aureobasidium pullulans]|nr:hypothetical protein D6C76_08405 [Aureobasidium pullulans]
MRENQKTHRPAGHVAKGKLDFAVRSENGLGKLDCLPREIRNMVYGFMVPSIATMAHRTDDSIINRVVLRALVEFPPLRTSKQLCVEFLEIYIRQSGFQESHDGLSFRSPVLETLLQFVDSRIRFRTYAGKLTIEIGTAYLYSEMRGYSEECRADHEPELPRQLNRLWSLHEKYDVPSHKLFIQMDYYEPGELIWRRIFGEGYDRVVPTHLYDKSEWIHKFDNMRSIIHMGDLDASAQDLITMTSSTISQVQDYCTSKFNEFRNTCTPAEYVLLERLVRKCGRDLIRRVVNFHISMMMIATEFWDAMEEQYNVHHLFDLAESRLDVD